MAGANTRKSESGLGICEVWAAWDGSVVWKVPFEYNEHSAPVMAAITPGSYFAIVIYREELEKKWSVSGVAKEMETKFGLK
jgi:hypothetical protein